MEPDKNAVPSSGLSLIDVMAAVFDQRDAIPARCASVALFSKAEKDENGLYVLAV